MLPSAVCSGAHPIIQPLQAFEVLHRREVTLACCPVQWCSAIRIPHIPVSVQLTQVLHRREEAICAAECIRVMSYSPLTSNSTCVLSTKRSQSPALQLGRLEESYHHGTTTWFGYRYSWGLSSAAPSPAHRMFLTKSTRRRASMDANVLNSGSVWCAYWRRLPPQCALHCLLARRT